MSVACRRGVDPGLAPDRVAACVIALGIDAPAGAVLEIDPQVTT